VSMDNKRYRRYFIILDNEDEGFDSKEGKRAKGYTKIEIKNGKGSLSHYIQNLRYFENAEYIYRGMLIGTKDGKGVYAETGSFIIDKSGKGELNWKFDPENVNGKGNSINDFNVIAIIADAKDGQLRGKTVQAPLVGFIDKNRVAWKEIIKSRYGEKKVPEIKVEEKYDNKNDLAHETFEQSIKYEEKTEVVKEIQETVEVVEKDEVIVDEEVTEEKVKEKIIEDTVEEIVQKDKDKDMRDEHEFEDEEDEFEDEEEEEEDDLKEEYNHDSPSDKEASQYDRTEYSKMKSYDNSNSNKYYQHYFRMVCGYVKNILKYYNEAEPFEKNIQKCKWWKIDCSQQTLYRNFLPFYGYISNMYYYYNNMNNMTGCSDLIYKYQHYIFGIVESKPDEAAYYIYGIPGRYILSEQPYEGMTGFVYWHPLENRTPQRGDYGYWLLYVDAKTGNIAMPQKPTPPPR